MTAPGHRTLLRGNRQTQPAVLKTLWLVGTLDVLAYLGGIASTYIRVVGVGGLAASLGFIAIVSFCGFFWFYQELRDAIAASVILFYVTLFASLFNRDLRAALDNDVGRTMLTSLTAFVSVIGGFYFAGKSLERAAANRAAAEANRPETQAPQP